MSTIAERWAQTLGMAVAPLFGAAGDLRSAAMLDGITGSHVLADETEGEIISDGASLAWSSLMRHHVSIRADEKVVVSKAALSSSITLTRSSVERDLEGFLSYLERTDNQPPFDIVDHVVASFQGLRAAVPAPSSEQLLLFLYLLAVRLEHPQLTPDQLVDAASHFNGSLDDYGISSVPNRPPASADTIRAFYETILTDDYSGRRVLLDLTVRHAGAELFQAAQLAPPVESVGQGSFLGLRKFRVRPYSLKDLAYTPIGLARGLAEQVIYRISQVDNQELVVIDPTCGSGSFLVETINALRRVGYNGRLRLIGYDIMESAVSAARFAVACARRDAPEISIEFEIERRDYLDESLPVVAADVVLMNPPYKSWQILTAEERERVRAMLGSRYRNRPDISTVFIEKALKDAKDGAVLGALLPAGVLTSASGRRWREELLDHSTPELLASLGDHSLFRYALVNAAAVVLRKAPSAAELPNDTVMLWASGRPNSASSALRELRRRSRADVALSPAHPEAVRDQALWRIYSIEANQVAERDSWLPAPRRFSADEETRLHSIPTRITDLFEVSLGIRVGARSAFIISKDTWLSLPERERAGFMPIAEKLAIANGTISPSDYLFIGGEAVETEEELKRLYPTFLKTHLLEKAARSKRSDDRPYWQLTRPRNEVRARSEPRIVSREWVKNDGFAIDWDGAFAPLGKAWFPTDALKTAAKDAGFTPTALLCAYMLAFNSDVFFKVLSEYSTLIAGGQVDLQKKYLKRVPLPFPTSKLLDFGQHLHRSSPFPPLPVRNQIAATLYGFSDITHQD